MGVKIKQVKHNDIPVLEITGKLSGGDAIKISKKLEAMVGKVDSKVALDLTEIQYLDSTWLGTFIYCMGLYKDNDKEIVFIIPDGFVMELFYNSNISSIATIYKTREELI